MAQQTINLGTVANDGTGDTLRDAGDKINDNFTELYGLASPPFSIGTGFEETPEASYVIARYTFAEDVDFADDFAGSEGNIDTNPTSSFVIDVAVNGSPVGTITISTGGAYTFATTGGALSCEAGDELLITAPATPDATAAGASFTLKGLRA
jgi:Bacteriophage T4 gp9/10-like protein.